MHYVLWFIYLVNGVLYSAPLHPYQGYQACQDAKELARYEMERDYPGDKMFFVCLDQSDI